MMKRRERALHLFQLTGRARTVNRLHVDKVGQGIVQKRSQRSIAICLDRGFASRGGSTESCPANACSGKSSGRATFCGAARHFQLPRDVALREEAEAFALQNRCGAL